MTLPLPALASAVANARQFFTNLFTGALNGDFLSLLFVGGVALVILYFTVNKWLFTLLKQTLIFGGLAFAVWFSSGEVGERYGAAAGQAVLWVGGAIVAGLFFIMLYMFFLRRSREKAGARANGKPTSAQRKAPAGKTTMRVGAGALAGQGLPVHYQKSATPAGAGGGSGGGGGGSSAATANADAHEMSKVEETLRKLNILGATKEQNLLTVAVLILVAQFGVFTSRTISAPDHKVGLFLFLIFIAAAVIFIKTAYKSYAKGITHFTFAILFAFGLSALMLVYWQQTFLCGDYPAAASFAAACAAAADPAASAPITWQTVAHPEFYFASDGLIAAITGVAFSTLLTKGGS